MVWVKRPLDLCLGFVGAGKTCVCLSVDGLCSVQSHKANKLETKTLPEAFLAICGADIKAACPTCHASLILPSAALGQELVMHLMDMDAKSNDLAGTLHMVAKGNITIVL